jgi:hypothetical protein
MKIVLMCESVEKTGPEKYKCLFSLMPEARDLIEIESEAPTIPGLLYTLLLRGVFPGYMENKEVVSDLLSMRTEATLTAISIQEEMDLKRNPKKAAHHQMPSGRAS